MQLLPATASTTESVVFQKPLKEPETKQKSPLFTLPLKILEHIGRLCPNLSTAISYTKTCRTLYPLRPTILITDLPKLQSTLEKLMIHQKYLTSFLDLCARSPHRNATFEITCSGQSEKNLITGVFPHVKVNLPRTVRITDLIANMALPVFVAPMEPRLLAKMIPSIATILAQNTLFFRTTPDFEFEQFDPARPLPNPIHTAPHQELDDDRTTEEEQKVQVENYQIEDVD